MRRLRRWAPLSLAATLVLVVSAMFFYGMTNRLEAAFVAQLTTDHTKCFIEAEPGSSIDVRARRHGWQTSMGGTSAYHPRHVQKR